MRSPQPMLNLTGINSSHFAFRVFLHLLTPLLLTTVLRGTSFYDFHFTAEILEAEKT